MKLTIKDNIQGIEYNKHISKYEAQIQDICWDENYGFSTDNWMFEGESKVLTVLEKMKLDKNITLHEFMKYLDYLRENGVYSFQYGNN